MSVVKLTFGQSKRDVLALRNCLRSIVNPSIHDMRIWFTAPVVVFVAHDEDKVLQAYCLIKELYDGTDHTVDIED